MAKDKIDSAHIKNSGRVETPHAWALDNASVLAECVPAALDLIKMYQQLVAQPSDTYLIARSADFKMATDKVDKLKEII
jgi:hypothetical protein